MPTRWPIHRGSPAADGHGGRQAERRRVLERVTFHSADSGFCVLRVKARGHQDPVTLVGHAATISAGELITALGAWVDDRTDGLQLKAHFLKTAGPSSIEGIEKHLGSGMIRGIGPAYPKRLVKHFRKEQAMPLPPAEDLLVLEALVRRGSDTEAIGTTVRGMYSMTAG